MNNLLTACAVMLGSAFIVLLYLILLVSLDTLGTVGIIILMWVCTSTLIGLFIYDIRKT